MWAKSPIQKQRPGTFSCTSFKDIQLLCSDDNTPPLPHVSPRSPSIFHRVRLVNSLIRSWSTRPQITLPNSEDKVVIYFTSLRVVRSTFDDCRTVLSILRPFRVQIDERDVSMDHTFISELNKIFSQKTPKSKISLPKVFIGGKLVGGADEIRQLHETGELRNLLAALPAARDGGACEFCGGIRFVLCDECNGSRKCYSEKGGFRTCGECNENGLLRCPYCSCS